MVFRLTHIVFYLICFLMTSVSADYARAENDPVFTIGGVEVDVTAENAAAAREQAFDQAQNIAFEKLAQRLLSESQMANFEMPQTSIISTLVKDFEVTQEKLSHVRYIGNYTFRFKNDAVRNYLGARGVSYTDVGSKPVLVLPFYQTGTRNILWGDDNYWLKAWSNVQYSRGLVPVIIPIGDLQDVSDIGDDEALSYTPENLENMKQRYGVGEAIIMLASPERSYDSADPQGLTLMVYRTDRGRPEFANRVDVKQEHVRGNETIFAAAVRMARDGLQQSWKSQTLTNAAQVNSMKVRVRFDNMKEWLETQKILRRVQGVDEMKLLSLKQNEANVELRFQGTEQRLRLALAQSDMTLSSPQTSYNGRQASYGYGNRSAVYDLYLNKYGRPQQDVPSYQNQHPAQYQGQYPGQYQRQYQ